ncbi:MAG: phage tail tape measure protein [Candidatus Helarchaeota archaeon]
MAAIVLKMTADNKAVIELKSLENQLKKLNKTATKTSKKTLSLTGAMKAMLGVSIIRKMFNSITIAIRSVVGEIAKYEDKLKSIEGISKASVSTMKSLHSTIMMQNNSTEHLASSTADATLAISKMGFTAKEAGKALPHIMNLATASIVEAGEASKTTLTILKAFGKEIEDVEHIVNVIQSTVTGTALDMTEFGESMKYVAPIADKVSVSVEETSAMIGILSNVGLKGSIAGTSLKNMFLNMLKPGEKVSEMLDRYNGEGKNFIDILHMMKDKGMSIVEFHDLFNKRALAGSLALANLADDVRRLTKDLEDEKTTAKEVADVMRESLIKQLQMLRNKLFGIGDEFIIAVQAGEQFESAMKDIGDELLNMQQYIKDNQEALKGLVTDFLNLFKAIIKTIIAIGKFIVKHKELIKVIVGLWIGLKIVSKVKAYSLATTGAAIATTKLTKAGKLLYGALGLVIIAAEAAVIAIDIYADKVDEAMRKSVKSADTTIKGTKQKRAALKEYMKVYDILYEKYKKSSFFGTEIGEENFKNQLQEVKDAIEKTNDLPETYFDFFDSHEQIVNALKFFDKELLNNYKRQEHEALIQNMLKDVADVEDVGTNYVDEILKQFKDKNTKIKGTGTPKKEYASLADLRVYLGVIKDLTSSQLQLRDAIILAMKFPSQKRGLSPMAKKGKSIGMDITDLTTAKEILAFYRELDNMTLAMFKVRQAAQTGKLPERQILKQATKDKAKITGQEPLSIEAKASMFFDFPKMGIQEKIKEQKKGIKEVQDLIEDNASKQKALIKEIAELKRQEKEQEKEQEKADYPLKLEEIQQLATNFIGIYQQIHDVMKQAIMSTHQQVIDSLKNEEKALKDKRARELRAAGTDKIAKISIEAAYRKKELKIQKEREKAELEYAKKKKTMAMVQAAINTALAISSVLAWQVGGIGTKAVAAAIVAALGIAQQAMIATQNFRFGGPAKSKDSNRAVFGIGSSDSILSLLTPGEHVLKKSTVQAVGGHMGVQSMVDDALVSQSTRDNLVVYIENNIGDEEYTRSLFKKINDETSRWNEY